ncbi:hypothetical protein E2C01_076075 [Portunus trituberculatus]|uniref:Uncharacterized protein n=1 Tax=Portunus trituberculatus TaxID=210409 RepID=A0A5B7IL30_PORTR|nr:hypothetical protein [Portunus trituberculatus]
MVQRVSGGPSGEGRRKKSIAMVTGNECKEAEARRGLAGQCVAFRHGCNLQALNLLIIAKLEFLRGRGTKKCDGLSLYSDRLSRLPPPLAFSLRELSAWVELEGLWCDGASGGWRSANN